MSGIPVANETDSGVSVKVTPAKVAYLHVSVAQKDEPTHYEIEH